VRLHYDDLEADRIDPDLDRAVQDATAAVAPGETVVVFSTYTAMWQLHQVLARLTGTELR
jgi:peroxiredoxin family protein